MYEEKKEMRERTREAARKDTEKKQRVSSVLKHAIWIAVLLTIGIGFSMLVKKELPQGEDRGVFYESQGQEHIRVGAEHPPYSSNPPSSGWHYVAPAQVGFYRDPLPDERVIHNLEHGDIWIAYRHGISETAIAALRAFENDGKVIITPREENEFDISLVAWEWTESFNVEDDVVLEERINDFLKRHRNQGPEKVNQPNVENGVEADMKEDSAL